MLNINIANDWFWTSDLWYQNATALPTSYDHCKLISTFYWLFKLHRLIKYGLPKIDFETNKSFKTFGCDLELLKAVAFLEEIKEV